MERAALISDDATLCRHLRTALARLDVEARVFSPHRLTTADISPFDWCFCDLGAARAVGGTAIEPLLSLTARVRFVALAAVPNAGQGLELLGAGVAGYANRWMSPAVLEALIQTLRVGGVWAGQEVTAHLLEQSLSRQAAVPERQDLLARLTDREREVADRVSQGLSNKVIAAEAGITERTVKAHLNAIYRKTGVRSRVQLALVLRQSQEAVG